MTSDLDITDSVLAELRSAADIVAVINDHTTLKKAGRSWKGLCPFHNERTPSFTVDRDKGLYHCFGCGAGGDVIRFVREIDRLDFPEAVEALASRFGVTIPRRQRRGPQEDRRDRILEAVAAAHRFYAERLARAGSAAAKYLTERGVPPELWKSLGLGHAPDAWDALGKAIGGAYPETLLVEAGLLQARAEGRGAYDRFRDRLLFVIKDDRGRPVGFGGRTLSPQGEPKYLNSPETPVFSKKRVLYGLVEAREAIRRRERVVLVEGYFDHLALIRAGIAETVASMGTALTPEQAEKLRRLCPNAVVCYDGDPAGRNATRAALRLLLAEGFRARVARLPEDEDPDDVLASEGPESLARRIDEAPDWLTWLLEDVRPGDLALSAAEKRERIATIQEVLGAIPDRVLRYEEYRKLSRAVSVPLEVLWETEKGNPSPGFTRSISVGTTGNAAVLSTPPPTVEARLLRAVIADNDAKARVFSDLKDEFLTDPTVKSIFSALRRAGAVDFHRQIAELTEEERTFLSGIALDESPGPTEKDVDQLIKSLEISHLRAAATTLRHAIKKAEDEGKDVTELVRQVDGCEKRIVLLKRKG
ncbi:MAG: DNA primase [Syntrophomonadaceae bacterium]